MRALVADGLEVTLLGQNVNSYGSDLPDGYRFPSLLRDVAVQTGVRLLRFVVPPSGFHAGHSGCDGRSRGRDLPSVNLPIQSGSDGC